ncbi:retrovirus-related pol polyprotein from transposon TNT 1-94 [Tanacetum coccineum]|uniref:Retrovirus-related pol polyprotein from transposon TNT 1-94 n=1 Tax=Tanacetum coccineum TaxID=301880 RepID=A0ABQ5G9R0_9ASTR
MARSLFNEIVTAVIDRDAYFRNNIDCTRKEGIFEMLKCTSSIRQLAYNVHADFLDEYMQISERSSCLALDHFCEAVMQIYGPEFLRKPTMTNVEKLYLHHEEKHGFPGMLGSLDCTDWEWFGCLFCYDVRMAILEEVYVLMLTLNLQADTNEFSRFYNFVFFVCRENSQRSIPVSRAIIAWNLVLSGRFRLLNEWCTFVEVDLKSKDNVSDSSEQSVEIDRLKQTLSEHVKEKESLMQTVSLLKNDFKKEESRNIDRESALEKKIKQLDNIVFKRDKSAQTLHMFTKPQFFYNHTTKQAPGFQNPFYLKKAQQLESKLYDGNVIKNTSAIVIPDSEETLLLAEEIRSKMLLKQQDPMMLEKKVNTTPVDYANFMNSSDPTPSCRPTKVEVPKEFPKVSMVNTSLKKLKHHLAGFDVVVKERTTTTAITEGSWGFEDTKACFRDEIIPFVKAQSQEKDTVIIKLKERIKSLSGNINEDKIKKDIEEIEMINIELDHKSVKISNLNASLQEQGVVITALKNELRKLKGKDLAVNVVTKNTINPEMLKIDVEPINPRLLNNRAAHSDYLKHTQEESVILKEIVEQGKSQNPLNNSLDSTLKPSTSASGSQPSGNTKKDMIQKTPNRNANVQHSKINANSELLCVKCNGCMLSDNHDLCVLDFINDVNARNKSKSVKKSSKRKVWKPTGKVVQIVLWYLDSGCSKHMTGDRSQLTNFVNKFLGTIKFGNDHVAKILGYGDYQIGNVMISRVYYVEGLGHNLFSVGKFYDSNLEVAFRQHTCFICNLEGVDLLTGSRGNNLYTVSWRYDGVLSYMSLVKGLKD